MRVGERRKGKDMYMCIYSSGEGENRCMARGALRYASSHVLPILPPLRRFLDFDFDFVAKSAHTILFSHLSHLMHILIQITTTSCHVFVHPNRIYRTVQPFCTGRWRVPTVLLCRLPYNNQ